MAVVGNARYQVVNCIEDRALVRTHTLAANFACICGFRGSEWRHQQRRGGSHP